MGYSVEFSTGTKKKNFHIAGKDDVIAKYNEGYQKGLDEGYENGVEDGRNAEQSDFWDNFQDYGNRVDYMYAFSGTGWNDEIFNPKYDIVPEYNMENIFYKSKMTNIKKTLLDKGITFDTSKGGSCKAMFYFSETSEAPSLDARGTTGALNSVYGYARKLVTIDKFILKSDGSQSFNSVFTDCVALENIVIEGVIGKNGFNISYSTLLTHDSLMSIINALQDKSTDTSGTTWTVTIGAANIEKLTDEELQIAYDKGWVVA